MDVGNSPAEAMRSAQPQKQLIVGSRGYPLSLGICYESLIVGSDTQILKQLSQSVMVIEEGKPVVLCSV